MAAIVPALVVGDVVPCLDCGGAGYLRWSVPHCHVVCRSCVGSGVVTLVAYPGG